MCTSLEQFTNQEFEKNVVIDPQRERQYSWQEHELWQLLYGPFDPGVLTTAEAQAQLDNWARQQGLSEVMLEEAPDFPGDRMLYDARDNVYRIKLGNGAPLLLHFHEFVHYWVLSAFSLGLTTCGTSIISPLTGHGPVYLRSFLHLLPQCMPLEVELEQIENSARTNGLCVADVDSPELENLWRWFRSVDKAIDTPELREHLSRLGSLDRPDPFWTAVLA